jgi:peptidoglycan/LPS O-acetylase OafA/YrhL
MPEPTANSSARPPGPIRAVVIILWVLSGVSLLLFLDNFVAGVNDPDPTGEAATSNGSTLCLGLTGLLTAWAVRRGRRGGQILGVLFALFLLLLTPAIASAPFPFAFLAVLPLVLGLVVVALLVGFGESREWFRTQ